MLVSSVFLQYQCHVCRQTTLFLTIDYVQSVGCFSDIVITLGITVLVLV